MAIPKPPETIEEQIFSSYKELKSIMLKTIVEQITDLPYNETDGNRLTIHHMPGDLDSVFVKWDDADIGTLLFGFAPGSAPPTLAYARKFRARFIPGSTHHQKETG